MRSTTVRRIAVLIVPIFLVSLLGACRGGPPMPSPMKKMHNSITK